MFTIVGTAHMYSRTNTPLTRTHTKNKILILHDQSCRFDLEPIEAFIGSSTLPSPRRGEDGRYYTSAFEDTTGVCNLWATTETDTDCTNWEIVKSDYEFCSR